MKKTISALATLAALCAISYAGPETFSGKEMKQVAPAPPPCPTWTGFYVGGFGGYKFGVIDPSMTVTGLFPNDITALEFRAGKDLDTSGGELGGLLGYNYEWNKWVVGAEVAGGYLWLGDSEFTGAFFSPRGNQLFMATSFKTHYLVTMGPRIGYAFCKWLPYATGGLAVGDLDFTQRFSAVDYSFSPRNSASETNAGWFVGGGLQYAITNHWSARVQYQYVDLGDVRTNESSAFSYTAQSEASLREHNASFAIVYGF
jgi:outer membrane immunogenic protein